MTSGSWNRGNYVTVNGGRVGIEDTRSWSGADSPRLPRPKLGTYETVRQVVRKDGSLFWKKVTIRYPRSVLGEQPKRKRLADNPYTMNAIFHKDAVKYMNRQISTQPWAELQSIMTPSNNVQALLTSNDQIAMVGKLREKLYGGEFNTAVFLGEGHQSLKMIADAAIRIAKSRYHLRKGDISGAARSLLEGTTRKPLRRRHQWDPKIPGSKAYPNLSGDTQVASNNWLELQYGWLPLLKDAHAGAEQLAHHLEVPMQTTYRVKKRREALFPYSNTSGHLYGSVSSTTVKSHSRSIIARIQEKDLPSVSRKLGLLDPELVMWELVPFSFVADWFIPIGSYLEARALSGSLQGTFVTSDLYTCRFDPRSVTYVKGTSGQYRFDPPFSPGLSYNRVRFTRSVSSVLSVPMPTMKPLKEVATWQHAANAIALVAQVFTRSKTEFTPAMQRQLRTPPRLPEQYWSF